MKNGFTLIELLVVISILAVLSAAGLAVYQNVQLKVRDSIRKSDLNKLALSLEAYFQKNGKYMDGTPGVEGNCSSLDTSSFYTNIASYMYDNTVPKDPKTLANYCYVAVGNNAQDFRLFAILENSADANLTGCISYNYSVVSDNLTVACPP